MGAYDTNIVYCKVKDCIYHKPDDKCNANEIIIDGREARKNDHTLCHTFTCK